MKAIILDYTDGSINILPIPKDAESNADDYVREFGGNHLEDCQYMIVTEEIPVYRISIVTNNNGDWVDTEYIRECGL